MYVNCMLRYTILYMLKKRKSSRFINLPTRLVSYGYSTFIILYPTPICVWIYCGELGSFSIFFLSVVINTRREPISVSHALPQIFSAINLCVSTFPTFCDNTQSSLYSVGVRCISSSSRYAQPAA